MDTLHIRINKKVKTQAGKTLAELGLDMSTAVKVFLHQVIVDEGLPFIPSKNAAALRSKWNKEVLEAMKKGKRFKTAEEMHSSF